MSHDSGAQLRMQPQEPPRREESLVPYKRARTLRVFDLVDACASAQPAAFATDVEEATIINAARALVRAADRYERMQSLLLAGADVPEYKLETLRDIQDAQAPNAEALRTALHVLGNAVRGAAHVLDVRVDES